MNNLKIHLHIFLKFQSWIIGYNTCTTLREACQWTNLLANDNHWDATYIRTLFAIITETCFPSNALNLGWKYKVDITPNLRMKCFKIAIKCLDDWPNNMQQHLKKFCKNLRNNSRRFRGTLILRLPSNFTCHPAIKPCRWT